MSLLFTCKFDEDRIKNEGTMPGDNVCPIISLWGKLFDAQGRVIPNRIVRFCPNLYLCLSWLSATLMKIWSKMKMLSIKQHFPHYKSMGAIGCRGNQTSDLICPKTLYSLSPTPIMLHIKFDQDWPTRLRDIKVWKCGTDDKDDDGQTDHWYTISTPCESSAPVS